ncbi:ArdC family protein (plasmid) [Kribbella sp. WER1]
MTKTRRKARRTSTPEQREAAQQRDAALAADADAALRDPELGARVAALIGGGSRLLSYSLRNQGLLMKQAAERGMPLHEVDSYRGWQARGRQVRDGEKSLKIVKPVGRDSAKESADDVEAIVLPRDDAAEQEDGGKTRFRITSVFEISQTDGPEEFDAITDEDGAAMLLQNLAEQADRYGYNVSVWAEDVFPVAGVEVDHEAASIAVSEDADPAEVLAQLAQEIAAIAVVKSAEGTARRAARKSSKDPADEVPTITVR